MQVKNCQFISKSHRSGLTQTCRVRCYTDGTRYRVDVISDVKFWGDKENCIDEGGVCGKHKNPDEQNDPDFWAEKVRMAMRKAHPWAPAWQDASANSMRQMNWRVVREALAVR